MLDHIGGLAAQSSISVPYRRTPMPMSPSVDGKPHIIAPSVYQVEVTAVLPLVFTAQQSKNASLVCYSPTIWCLAKRQYLILACRLGQQCFASLVLHAMCSPLVVYQVAEVEQMPPNVLSALTLQGSTEIPRVIKLKRRVQIDF